MISRIASFCLLALIGTSVLADERQPLAVTYYHYPPYLLIENGKPAGLYADNVVRIAEMAGMRVVWQLSTIDEEARMLDDGRRPFCTTGRLPTPERIKNWAFLPYIFDVVPGDIVVSSKSHLQQVRDHTDVAELVSDKTLTGTLLESGIYGDAVDKILNTQNPSWILRTGKTDFQLINMILAGRAHYGIVPEDQWQFALRDNPAASQLIEVPNMGTLPSLPIYLACSRKLSKDTLDALAQAMEKLGFVYSPIQTELYQGN